MPGIVETTLVQVFSRLESPATSGQSGEQAGDSQSGVVLTVLKNLERIVIVENSKIKRKLIKKRLVEFKQIFTCVSFNLEVCT